MNDEKITALIGECEAHGITRAEALAKTGARTHEEWLALHEWIANFRQREREDLAEEQRRISEDALYAARDSADISRQAADSSARSAMWTMWAAIAAAATALVPLLQAYGLLKK